MSIKKLWGISLMIIGIAGVLLGIGNITGFGGDTLIRAMGIVQILCLPVLVFSTVKMLRNK